MTIAPGLRLRAAGAGDALVLSVLGAQVFAETYATGGMTQALAREIQLLFSMRAFELLLADRRIEILVAEEPGGIRGFAQLHRESPCPVQTAQPAMVELQRLYVQQSATGRGTGKTLLRAAESRAADAGQATLWLSAWTGNARALAFYPAQGYEDIGATEYTFEGASFANRVFARRLR